MYQFISDRQAGRGVQTLIFMRKAMFNGPHVAVRGNTITSLQPLLQANQ